MMRQLIGPEIKIAITLRFLATGESYESLMYQFRVHSSAISKFISFVTKYTRPSRDDSYDYQIKQKNGK